jgi:hypothetical protein
MRALPPISTGSCRLSAALSVWLEVRFERVRNASGLHNGNCGGKDTIERPKETLGDIRREPDRQTLAPKLSVRGVGGFVRLAKLRCRHYYIYK